MTNDDLVATNDPAKATILRMLFYARAGYLDFFPLLSKELEKLFSNPESRTISNTHYESTLISERYQIGCASIEDAWTQFNTNKHDYESELLRIENQYPHISLRSLCHGERYEYGFSDDRLLMNLVFYFNFWEQQLKTGDIDLVVSERPATMSQNVLWSLCKTFNIKFLEPLNLGLFERIFFTDSWEGSIIGFQQVFESTAQLSNESKLYAENFTKNLKAKYKKPEYLTVSLSTGKKTDGRRRHYNLPSTKNLSILLKKAVSMRQHRKFYLNKTIRKEILDMLLHELRMKLHSVINVFDELPQLGQERYFLFPLHVEHEWTLYQQVGIEYPNTIKMIEFIAEALPFGVKLYVKEHTSGFPDRPVSFYRALTRVRNVRLVEPNVSVDDLMNASEGVITFGGTMGWEAFHLNTPVFLLAKTWYDFLPGITVFKDFRSLALNLQTARSQSLATEDDKEKAIRTLYDISVEAYRYPIVELTNEENIIVIAHLMKKYIQYLFSAKSISTLLS